MQTITMLLSVLSATLAADAKSFDPPESVAAEIRTLLGEALVAASDSSLTPEERLSLLDSTSAKAVERLQPHSPLSERLAAAVEQPDELSFDDQLALVKQAIVSVLGDLTFEPIAEADVPQGFPTYTPVGTIELKKYPAYRMAAGPSFWTLFMHIQLNRIEMTAPVQMNFTQDGADAWKESGMAFLYGDTEIGSLGRQGKVTVVENESQTVVSLGLKGQRTPSVIADALRRLQLWIDDHEIYQASGGVRVMGYNSPYVPQDKQYFEVQIRLQASDQLSARNDER